MTSAQSARSKWFVNGHFLNHMAKFVESRTWISIELNEFSLKIIQRLCLTLPLFEDNENTADS